MTPKLFLLSAIAALLSLALANAETIKLADYSRLVRLSDPRIEPNGQSAVVVSVRVNSADDAFKTDLLQVDLTTGQTHPLAAQLKGVHFPRWSPKGGKLAFLALSDGKMQIYKINFSVNGEPVKVTDTSTGVVAFTWKPDGSQMAYISPDEAPRKEKSDDGFEVGEYDYLLQAPPPSMQLWTIPDVGGSPNRLTSGPSSIAIDLGMPHQWPGLTWASAPRNRLAFLAQPSAGSRSSYLRQIQTVTPDGQDRVSVANASKRNCGSPEFSPDNRWLALVCPVDAQVKNLSELVVMPAAGGAITRLSGIVDRHISRAIWINGGKSLVTAADDGVRTGLWTIPVAGAAQRWDLGDVCITGLGQGGPGEYDADDIGRVVLAGTEPAGPPELYVADGPHAPPHRLTSFNADLAALQFGNTEALQWKSIDGLELSGVLVYPPTFDPSKQYPLLTVIHGGPWGSAKQTFDIQAQYFAAHGWLVFAPNYRGSDSAGNSLYSAIYRDQSAGPARDIMEGLQLLKKRRYVDQSRLGVSGWSYGGSLTAWLITHYQGWKAAMPGAAVINFEDDNYLADVRMNTRLSGDTLTTPADIAMLRNQSAFSFVDNVHTPVLMISDLSDQRVPVVQSYKFLRALQERGQEAHLFVYPVRGHYPPDPARYMDIDKRWADWFEQKFRQ